jgi:acyl-CoA thioesterase I
MMAVVKPQMSQFAFFVVVASLVLSACSRNHETAHEASHEAANDSAPQPVATPVPPAHDDRKVLVVFGDSLAAGYGLPAGRSFPDCLQKNLDAGGYAWHVVNLGISGDTTEGGLARIDSATSLKPSIAIVELGGNDGLRGTPLARTRENLDHIIGAFKGAGAKIVLAGMTLPPNYGPDYVRDFGEIYTQLAEKYHAKLIPFLLGDIVTKDMRYFQPDGIHPTTQGAEIVAGTVQRAVQPLLGKNSPNDLPVRAPERPR